MDLKEYRQSAQERARIDDLMRIIPKGRSTILDIGARDGYISKLLASYFEVVTALDLEKPDFDIANVITVKGDVSNLDFPDNHFDVVLCTEVLEHIRSELLISTNEIARVAKHEVVVGVPYKQDIRAGRTRCGSCKRKNPPWGHVNTFDEETLMSLFQMLTPLSTTYVGKIKERQNALSAYLMDIAGNPLGTYGQEGRASTAAQN